MENKNKPVQLIIADFKSALTSAVNGTALPMVFITPVIKELYEQCQLLEREQFRQAKEEYENSINGENNQEMPQDDIAN